jgi:hypothetical protein
MTVGISRIDGKIAQDKGKEKPKMQAPSTAFVMRRLEPEIIQKARSRPLPLPLALSIDTTTIEMKSRKIRFASTRAHHSFAADHSERRSFMDD